MSSRETLKGAGEQGTVFTSGASERDIDRTADVASGGMIIFMAHTAISKRSREENGVLGVRGVPYIMYVGGSECYLG